MALNKLKCEKVSWEKISEYSKNTKFSLKAFFSSHFPLTQVEKETEIQKLQSTVESSRRRFD